MKARNTIRSAIALACMVATGAMAQNAVVTIAHVGPTSGPIALGKDNENGARLAVEELNAAGVTVGGRKKVTLKLLVEDDAADPKPGNSQCPEAGGCQGCWRGWPHELGHQHPRPRAFTAMQLPRKWRRR